MKTKRIFILLGNPVSDSLNGSFAEGYEKVAKESGHEVRRLNIGDLKFDPLLHQGYRVIQELEPDLKMVQEHIKWADHFVLIYPLWWSGMPALLKGMFDRMWLPRFAFSFRKSNSGWDRLLKGKTARVIVTSKLPPMAVRFFFGDFSNEITRAILWFSGFKVRLTEIGNAEQLPEWRLKMWFATIARLAKAGK